MPTREDILNAAYAGDTDKLRQLAAEGADFNEIDKSGDTPLHEAIMEICSVDNPWRYEVVSTLLKLGADPNILGEFGDGPLTIAMYRMDVPMLRMLLESGADPNKPALLIQNHSMTSPNGTMNSSIVVLIPTNPPMPKSKIQIYT